MCVLGTVPEMRRHAAHGAADKPVGWTIRVSITGKDIRFCFSLERSDLLWHPPSLLFSGVKGLKQRGKLTPRIYIIPRLRMGGAMPLLPLYIFMSCTGGQARTQNFGLFSD